MREIIFRGKRLDNGKWAEGFYISHLNACHYIIPFRTGGYEAMDNSFYVHKWFEVDPSTIGQYTGLKDKNGEMIFEGDIVRCGTGRVCKVTFFISPGVSGFDLVPIGGFDAPPPHNWSLFADTEIIGNVHDNPELLKEEAQQ